MGFPVRLPHAVRARTPNFGRFGGKFSINAQAKVSSQENADGWCHLRNWRRTDKWGAKADGFMGAWW
ncbi:hypothetical protein JCM12296A_06000 [Desulfosarcina cetonica]